MKLADPELNIGGILRFFVILATDISAIQESASDELNVASFTLAGSATWLELPVIEDQSSYKYSNPDSIHGEIINWEVTMQTPQLSKALDQELARFKNREVICGVLDNNLAARIFGNSYHGARLQFQADTSRSSGGLNAYNLTIAGQSLKPPLYTDISNFTV